MLRRIHLITVMLLTALVLTFSVMQAEIVFSPDSLDFGDIPVGATVTRTFWVKNTGTDSLKKDFSSKWTTFVKHNYSQHSLLLAPGDSVLVSLGITALALSGSASTYVYFGNEFDFFPDTSLTCPALTYRVVSSGLDWQPLEIERCMHEQRITVSGIRVAAIQNAQLQVIPDSGIVVRRVYATSDSFVVGVNAPLFTPERVYKLLFIDGVNTLDSLYFQVIPSWPIVFHPADTMWFNSQKHIDTLYVKGWNLFSHLLFEFPSSGLTIMSTEIFPDTLARLVVRSEPGAVSGFVEFNIVNPDTSKHVFVRSIYVSSDALQLTPESGNPGAQLPRAFSLGANYPNPFNPSTTINYSVAGNAPVRVVLRVFNLRGQTVATLVDRVTAPGEYSVEWDGSDSGGAKLSSGIYFYRMTAGDFSFTRKMVLLK